MEIYSRSQVAQLLHVDPRKIEGWVARGVLRPHGSGGTGNPYQFSFAEIVRAAIIHHGQEDLGSRFVRPGSLSKLLHEQFSDHTIGQERRRIEEAMNKEPKPRKGRIPRIEPDDLILYIYRGLAEKEDGTVVRSDLQIKETRGGSEHFFPLSYFHLRVTVGIIIRSILIRMKRMELKAE